jgi:hypothetical protein
MASVTFPNPYTNEDNEVSKTSLKKREAAFIGFTKIIV